MANSFGYRWRPPTDRSVFLPRKASANNGADRAFLSRWKFACLFSEPLERSEAVERLERLERTDPRDDVPNVAG